MTVVQVFVPGVLPPSMNVAGSRGHWRANHEAKKDLQKHLGMALLVAQDVPRGCSMIVCDATLRVFGNRRRDTGNFRTPLEKALGDALQEGGFLADDTPEFYDFASLIFEVVPEKRLIGTLLRLTCDTGSPAHSHERRDAGKWPRGRA